MDFFISVGDWIFIGHSVCEELMVWKSWTILVLVNHRIRWSWVMVIWVFWDSVAQHKPDHPKHCNTPYTPFRGGGGNAGSTAFLQWLFCKDNHWIVHFCSFQSLHSYYLVHLGNSVAMVISSCLKTMTPPPNILVKEFIEDFF